MVDRQIFSIPAVMFDWYTCTKLQPLPLNIGAIKTGAISMIMYM